MSLGISGFRPIVLKKVPATQHLSYLNLSAALFCIAMSAARKSGVFGTDSRLANAEPLTGFDPESMCLVISLSLPRPRRAHDMDDFLIATQVRNFRF